MIRNLEKTRLTLGFIPLTDCAPLVVAAERGWFRRYGLEVHLSKETSWANIRDKVALGVLDGAHMLAPMPLAATLNLGPMAKPMLTALSLGINGNAITVSRELHARMREVAGRVAHDALAAGRALRRLIEADRNAGRPPLTFAAVFPFSMHHYQLRHWLAVAGIDPERDVRFTMIPPARMVNSLQRGEIDAFCVGEPWNSVAVRDGTGRVLATGYDIWNNGPEKVFGVTQEWAEQHPNTHLALICALLDAARWVDAPENRPEVVSLISRSVYVNAPPDTVRMSMNGTFQYSREEFPHALPDFNVFFRYAATFPWRSHALWILAQMVRWKQIETPCNLRRVAESVYRPDIYRRAALLTRTTVPAADYKNEGVHDAGWTTAGFSGIIAMGSDCLLDGASFSPVDPLHGIEAATGYDPAVWKATNPGWNAKELAGIAADLPAAAAGETQP